MTKLRKSMLIIIMCMLAAFLTGCWNQKEIEERASIMAIAFDTTKKADTYKVSVQIPIPLAISGGEDGGGGEGSATKIITVKADSLSGAKQKIENQINEELFFGHTLVIAFSEKLARKGIKPLLHTLRHTSKIRRLVMPVIVKGDNALKLLKFSPELKQIPSLYLMTMMENKRDKGKLPNLTLGQFYTDLAHPTKHPKMVTYKVGDKKVEINGLSLFKDTNLSGFLNINEMSQWLRLVQGKNGEMINIKLNDDHHMYLMPKDVQSTYQIKYHNNTVYIHADVDINSTITEMDRDLSYIKHKKAIKSKIETILEKRTDKLIKKAQRDLKTDIFYFGEHIRTLHYRTIWKKINWEKAFPDAHISVSYHVNTSKTYHTVG